jgi:hypothetical protein
MEVELGFSRLWVVIFYWVEFICGKEGKMKMVKCKVWCIFEGWTSF